MDLFVDPGAPMIDVNIQTTMIRGAQLDGGAVVVNLITEQTMEVLGLKGLESTSLILRLADQRKVKPLGVLRNVKTIIAGLNFEISFLVVFPISQNTSYPMLLGRPWLLASAL